MTDYRILLATTVWAPTKSKTLATLKYHSKMGGAG